MKTISFWIAIGVIAIMFGFASWYVGRIVNYNLSYRGMVEDTIREMVKPEALLKK